MKNTGNSTDNNSSTHSNDYRPDNKITTTKYPDIASMCPCKTLKEANQYLSNKDFGAAMYYANAARTAFQYLIRISGQVISRVESLGLITEREATIHQRKSYQDSYYNAEQVMAAAEREIYAKTASAHPGLISDPRKLEIAVRESSDFRMIEALAERYETVCFPIGEYNIIIS